MRSLRVSGGHSINVDVFFIIFSIISNSYVESNQRVSVRGCFFFFYNSIPVLSPKGVKNGENGFLVEQQQ